MQNLYLEMQPRIYGKTLVQNFALVWNLVHEKFLENNTWKCWESVPFRLNV